MCGEEWGCLGGGQEAYWQPAWGPFPGSGPVRGGELAGHWQCLLHPRQRGQRPWGAGGPFLGLGASEGRGMGSVWPLPGPTPPLCPPPSLWLHFWEQAWSRLNARISGMSAPPPQQLPLMSPGQAPAGKEREAAAAAAALSSPGVGGGGWRGGQREIPPAPTAVWSAGGLCPGPGGATLFSPLPCCCGQAMCVMGGVPMPLGSLSSGWRQHQEPRSCRECGGWGCPSSEEPCQFWRAPPWHC